MEYAKKLSTVLSVFAAALLVSWCTHIARELRDERDLECLMANIVYEAGTEPDRGKRFVAWVTVARTLSAPLSRNTVCAVVFARRQFSWTREEGKSVAQGVRRASVRDREIAQEFLAQKHDRARIETTAKEFGIPSDAIFYKRHDWNENDPKERRMSEENKWYWKTCLRPILDSQGMPLRIGSHVPYRQIVHPCPKWPGNAKPETKTGAP